MTTAISPSVFRASVAQVEGPSVADVLRMDSIRDKAAGGPFDVFCKCLRNDWRCSHPKVQEQMVTIFEALDSDNVVVASNAHQILTFLEESNVTNWYEMIFRTLPLLPEPDFPALHQIAVECAGSKNEIVRKRAFHACVELARRNHVDVVKVMAERVSLNLRNPDEKIRGEGLDYFATLFERQQSDLLEADLSVAIDVASKIYFSDAWQKSYAFFYALIEYGNPEHVLTIKQLILDACTLNRPLAFDLCHRIVATHCQREDVLSIPLQVVNNACESEDQKIRDEGFKLFGSLLLFAPNLGLPRLIQAILRESEREDPCDGFQKKLDELVTEDSLSVGDDIRFLMNAHWKEHGRFLLEALDNLSSSGCFKERAAWMKEVLESRFGKP